MRTVLTADLKMVYPTAVFGSLVAREVPNRKRHEALEDLKYDLERKIREVYVDVDEDGTIQGYDIYFAWCPYGMGEKIINAHLNDILSNLGLVFESITSEIQIHK